LPQFEQAVADAVFAMPQASQILRAVPPSPAVGFAAPERPLVLLVAMRVRIAAHQEAPDEFQASMVA